MFEPARMKKISAATIKSAGGESGPGASHSMEVTLRMELKNVAQSFILLQQARHDADYDLDPPLDPADAVAQVDQALSAFESWGIASDSDAAREYLFSLLFNEKERT